MMLLFLLLLTSTQTCLAASLPISSDDLASLPDSFTASQHINNETLISTEGGESTYYDKQGDILGYANGWSDDSGTGITYWDADRRWLGDTQTADGWESSLMLSYADDGSYVETGYNKQYAVEDGRLVWSREHVYNYDASEHFKGGTETTGCEITEYDRNWNPVGERLESSCLTQYYRDAFMRLQSCSDDEEAIAGLSHMGTIRDGGLVVISMVNDITPERVTLYYGDGAPHEIPVMTDMTVIENVKSTENEYKLRVAFEKNGIFYDQFASEVSNIAIDVNSPGRTYIIEYDEVKSCVKDDSCLCPFWEINDYTISEVNRIKITKCDKIYTLSDSDVDCNCLKECCNLM